MGMIFLESAFLAYNIIFQKGHNVAKATISINTEVLQFFQGDFNFSKTVNNIMMIVTQTASTTPII